MADRPLFDPTALFAGRPFDLGFYFLAILPYFIHTPVQELVARWSPRYAAEFHPDPARPHQLDSNRRL
jgi:hypothetical protein